MESETYFDVALSVPLNKTFLYRHPDETADAADPDSYFGRRLDVRFGNRSMTGFIVGTHTAFPEDCGVPKEKVRRAVKFTDKDGTALLTHELYDVAGFMSRYYIAPIGEAVSAMIPSGKRESGGGFPFDEDEASYARHDLSEEQQKAVDGILSEGGKAFHYLYGMTGSGKTEVFLAAAEHVLSQGKGVIYLVPEIALTPQVAEAVMHRFGNTAAVLHSSLTQSQRLGEWKRILRKEARVVVGARSAVFAPVPDLGLVIMDEEHDGSYKSGSSPRYHARQVAMHRAARNGCPLVMGSATPSVEAWKCMKEGTFEPHVLTHRLAGGAMPDMQCVRLGGGSDSCISPQLHEAMKETLKKKRQVILFLNRRGFTHFFRCQSCGFELMCRNCSVPLTYHKAEKRLRCHYCGYSVAPPQQCPECGSLDVGYSGFGTEYIEAEVKAKFPDARAVRIDTDSLTRKGELQEKLRAFRNGEYDILMGTQMVAKGLNFPGLMLVGVVLADTALHLPDFRAAERTFSLITQVAGRAGRFFPDGKVIVQTYSPEREAIAFAVRGDTEGFYRNELSVRGMLFFPPYSRLLRIVIRAPDADMADVASSASAEILRHHAEPGVDILGPAECPLEMVSGSHRRHVLLRAKRIEPLQKMARILAEGYEKKLRDVHLEIDVDPVSIL